MLDLSTAIARLAAAGCGAPRLDAQLLLAETLGIDRAALVGRTVMALTPDQAERFETLLARRARREPMAQILGRREFWGRSFRVTNDTLDPRPDSETLISAALQNAPPARILDLGTGSGCLLLTLLAEWPGASGLGIDLSPAALAVAEKNALSLGVNAPGTKRAEFRQGRWYAPLHPAERFDLVISNPPYIPTAEIGGLAPEVARFEPVLALDGGADGLEAYRALVAGLASVLRPGGTILFEVGAGQAPKVVEMLTAAGASDVSLHADLAGIPRVTAAKWRNVEHFPN